MRKRKPPSPAATTERRKTALRRLVKLKREREAKEKGAMKLKKKEQHEELQEKSNISFNPLFHVARKTRTAAGNAKAGAPLPSTDRVRASRIHGEE